MSKIINKSWALLMTEQINQDSTLPKSLFHYVIRLSKEDSAFFYFQFEASEGLCFYSTLPFNPHDQFRDIDLKGDIRLKPEVDHTLSRLSTKFSLNFLVNEVLEF